MKDDNLSHSDPGYVKSAYETLSKGYDSHRNRSPYFKIIEGLTRKCFYENTSGKTFARGLDIGCGTGRNVPMFLEKCGTVKGLDYTPSMLDVAKSKFNDNENVDLMIGNVLNLPFKDETFDLIGCFKVLPHVPGANKGIKEISRVAKKKATIFLEFYSPYSFRRLLSRMKHYTDWHTPSRARQLITQADLTVKKVYGLRTFMAAEFLCYLPGGYKFFYFLENYFTNTPLNHFSGYYIVVCEK